LWRRRFSYAGGRRCRRGMTTCPAPRLRLGDLFGDQAIGATKFFVNDCAIGHSSEGFTISTKCRASLGARQEIADCRSDLVTVRLEGEVAGVEEAHVSVWNVTLERLGARRQEKRVVLAPSCEKRRLVLAKIGLEFGIQRDVALVVAEEVELDFISTGAG